MIKERFRCFYKTFICLKGEPKAICAGLAMGVFVGVTPTIPFHTAIIVALGLLFRCNIAAAYLGSWMISNPLTIPFFYVAQYELGRLLLGMTRYRFTLADYSFSSFVELGWHIIVPLLTGGIVMAPVMALGAYVISRRLLKSFRSRAET